MSKRTPGPWFVGAQNDALYIIDRRPNATGNDYPNHEADTDVVAKVYDNVRGVEGSGPANAESIVLACNAFDELMDIAEKLSLSTDEGDDIARGTHYVGKDGRVYCKGSFLELIEQARNAIAAFKVRK